MISTEITHAPVTIHQLKIDNRKMTKSMVEQIPLVSLETFIQRYEEDPSVALGYVRHYWKRCGADDGPNFHVIWVLDGHMARTFIHFYHAQEHNIEYLEEGALEAETAERREEAQRRLGIAIASGRAITALQDHQIYL